MAKVQHIDPSDAPLYRRKLVIKVLAGEGMLKRCEAAGWLEAKVREPKYVVYARDDVLAVVARLAAGESPKVPRSSKNAK
jgi:hypothetical protein